MRRPQFVADHTIILYFTFLEGFRRPITSHQMADINPKFDKKEGSRLFLHISLLPHAYPLFLLASVTGLSVLCH